MKEKFWYWVYKIVRRHYREHLRHYYASETNHIKSNGFTIRHHAYNRYFERIEGYDLKEIANKLTDNLEARVLLRGDGKYDVDDGITIVVIGNSIVTMYPTKDAVDTGNRIRGLEKYKELMEMRDDQRAH